MPDSSKTEGGGGEEWVTIARLLRTRGNRGELSAESLSTHPERYSQLTEVFLFDGNETLVEDRPFRVESVWWHGERLIFKFSGVDSISEAEPLAGSDVRIPMSQRWQVPPDEYYQSDLVGCEVLERTSGKRLGRVAGWMEGGGSGLLEVSGNGNSLLVPFARSICVEIDLEKRTIRVELPEGLEDLSRE